MTHTDNQEIGFAISVPIGGYHPLLRDCLRSLAIQTPRPQIAALDASGDPKVAAVLDEFADIIAYRRAGPDGGQSDAIIEGWENVAGDVLGWLNADDALYPGALAEAAAHFRSRPETDVFYGHTVIIDDDDIIKGYHWAVEPPSERILSGGIISQPSCFFKRRKLNEIGGLDRDLHYTMDWDLWVRFWRAGADFQFTENTLSRVLWSREAKTGGFNRARRRELERIIGANANFIQRVKSRLGFALHHVFEYLTPPALADAVRRRPGNDAHAVHGLARSGEVKASAVIPLVHFDDAPKERLIVSLEGEGFQGALSAGASRLDAVGGGDYELALKTPAPPGETLALEIETQGSKPMRLIGLRWA